MKKIYLVIALLAATVVAQARELRFYLGDQQIEEASTVSFNDVKTEYGEVIMAPELYLWSDLLTNTVKLTVTSLSGETVQCCAGGLCVAGTNIVKENIKIGTGEKLDLQFEYMGFLEDGEEIPTVKVQFDAVDVNNEDAKASFTLVMNDGNTSVTVIENDEAFRITPAGIAYNIDGDAKASIYTITGKKAFETSISGNGVLSTDGMAEGLYIYSIEGAKVKKTGKIYIF